MGELIIWDLNHYIFYFIFYFNTSSVTVCVCVWPCHHRSEYGTYILDLWCLPEITQTALWSSCLYNFSVMKLVSMLARLNAGVRSCASDFGGQVGATLHVASLDLVWNWLQCLFCHHTIDVLVWLVKKNQKKKPHPNKLWLLF